MLTGQSAAILQRAQPVSKAGNNVNCIERAPYLRAGALLQLAISFMSFLVILLRASNVACSAAARVDRSGSCVIILVDSSLGAGLLGVFRNKATEHTC